MNLHMTPQKAQKEFEGQLAALELVVMYLDQAVSLLRRSVEGKLSLKHKDNDIVRIVSTHYIVNNLNALFDNKEKRNSLSNIAKNFEKHFPNNFFSGHVTSIGDLRIKYAADLERIKKNRHLSTAHLGADKNERLGWPPHVAKNIDEILGTQSPVAQKDSLRFITPFQVFDMSIIQAIPKIKGILEELQIKFLTRKKEDAL